MVLNTRGLGYINEGVIDRIKEVGKRISNLISSPTVTDKINRQLREAKKEGRYFDVQFLKEFKRLRAKKEEDLTQEEEGYLYLFTKTYIELPDAIASAKTANTLNSGLNLWQSYQNDSLRRKLDKANARADAYSSMYWSRK